MPRPDVICIKFNKHTCTFLLQKEHVSQLTRISPLMVTRATRKVSEAKRHQMSITSLLSAQVITGIMKGGDFRS